MIQHNEQGTKNRFKRYFQKKIHFRYLFMGAAALLVLTFVLQLAWNVVLPALFGITAITFWQALGLMVLLRLTSRIMGFTRHRPMNTRPKYAQRGRSEHAFFACDSHRVI